jgi:hypothetical protein
LWWFTHSDANSDADTDSNSDANTNSDTNTNTNTNSDTCAGAERSQQPDGEPSFANADQPLMDR